MEAAPLAPPFYSFMSTWNHAELVGKRLQGGRYELTGLLGRGGQGAVYLAFDHQLEREVAVKLLGVHSGTSAQRFVREAKIIARLEHNHIMRVYEFGQDPELGVLFFVSERIKGSSLAAWLSARGAMSHDAVNEVVQQVASALQSAHDQGVFHRDLKPSNIMLSTPERGLDARIIDFGIAKVDTEGGFAQGSQGGVNALTLERQELGTPYYMAPEQLNFGVIDGRTDQHALAICVYQMLAGRIPYDPGMTVNELCREKLHGEQRPLSVFGVQTSAEVQAVLSRALAKRADERFATIAAFASAFDAAVLRLSERQSGRVFVDPMSETALDPGVLPTRLSVPDGRVASDTLSGAVEHDLTSPGVEVPGVMTPTPRAERRPVLVYAIAAIALLTLGAAGSAVLLADDAADASPERANAGAGAAEVVDRAPAEIEAPELSPLDVSPGRDALHAAIAAGVARASARAPETRRRSKKPGEKRASARTLAPTEGVASKSPEPKSPEPVVAKVEGKGKVRFIVIPYGYVFVDGKSIGEKRVVELPLGEHQAYVMYNGERSDSKTFRVTADEQVRVKFDLLVP